MGRPAPPHLPRKQRYAPLGELWKINGVTSVGACDQGQCVGGSALFYWSQMRSRPRYRRAMRLREFAPTGQNPEDF